VNVNVNGEPREVSDQSTVAEVVSSGGAAEGGRGIAVAVNGEVVRRSEWGVRRLRDRDHVEILRAVGGG
jgi:sulfur carrier protein